MAETILDGGTKTTQDHYTGPENELTVDQSNRNLRLHDGTTPGGYTFLNRDNSDARYQARSTELDGLTGFEPQQRGILTRLGPADYRLRTLTVDANNMVVSNANGYTGNPLIGLAPTIESEHTWNGQHIFNDVVQFNAGINADVSGNLTGDVVGNVTGDVVGDLTGDAKGNHTGTFTGDVDVRSFNILFDDDQIPTSKIAGLIDFIKLHGFPAGAITMWSGAEDAVPDGWYLCNGFNSTPDLRNKFIVGAGTGGDYSVADTGGFNTQFPTVTIYNSGAHTHSLSGSTLSSVTGVSLNLTITRPEYEQHQVDVVGNASLTDPGHTHGLGGQADTNGVHTHTGDVSSFDNRPPYYAMCYIMKG
jgi:hypothetical protein